MAAIESRFRVDGKVAVVTGASSGLGAGFAKALAEAGADLVLGARRVDRLEETRAAIAAMGRRVIAIATDVSKPESCQALIDGAMAEFGRVDILVNNAGVGTAIPALKETPAQIRRATNATAEKCASRCEHLRRRMVQSCASLKQ